MNRSQLLLRSLAVGALLGLGTAIATAADSKSPVPTKGTTVAGGTTKGTPATGTTSGADPASPKNGPGLLPDIIQGLLDMLQMETDTNSQKQITEFFLLLLMFLNQSQVPTGTAPMGN